MHKATDKKIAFSDNSHLRFSVVRKVFYTFLHHKKIIKKTIIGVITFAFLISPFSFLRAEDYPAGFLGPGYREYLSEKKQNGYYVDVFTKIDLCQKERVNKRNQVEEILAYAYQAAPESANGILAAQFQYKYNTDNLKKEIIQQRQQREQGASAGGAFIYIPHSDGEIAYFKDGLIDHIENERVVDEFGNVSYRNSYNYQYDDKRLLTGFEADVKDVLGNITHIRQYGMQYTADSLFYATKNTNANKNIIEYFLEETDPAGNKKVTHFYGGGYEGKLLRAFSETIEDSIYGNASFTRSNITYANNDPERTSSYHEEGIGTDNLAYTLDRTDITYNGEKDQLTGYHEVIITTQIDGTKTKATVEAKFKYLGVEHLFGPDVEEPDPDRLLESIITQTVENADGSQRTEATTTTYKYEGIQLIGASGHSNFNGQESKWYEYKDSQSHILTRNVDENSNVTYSYVDPDTLETIFVDPSEVTITLQDGNYFRGSSEIQFEILAGKPMTNQVHAITSYLNPEDGNLFKIEDSTLTYNNGLVNNLQRVLGSQEHTEVAYPFLDPDNSHREIRDIGLIYYYNEKGNFADAKASGNGIGWEYSSEKGWYGKHKKTITIEYDIILNKPLQKIYHEDKDYEGGTK